MGSFNGLLRSEVNLSRTETDISKGGTQSIVHLLGHSGYGVHLRNAWEVLSEGRQVFVARRQTIGVEGLGERAETCRVQIRCE